MSSVVLLLVPALLVPCLCVGLILAVGRLGAAGRGAARAGGGGYNSGTTTGQVAGHSSISGSFGATIGYRQLPGGPRYGGSSSSSSSHVLGSSSSGCVPGGLGVLGAADHRICSTLFTKTFNLKGDWGQ